MGQSNNKPGFYLGTCSPYNGGDRIVETLGGGEPILKSRSPTSKPPQKLVRVADLPEVEVPDQSTATKEDMNVVRSFVKLPDLSAEDIVVVKQAWNRTLAWKDMLMEAVIYKWIQKCPVIYDNLQVKFDEMPQDLFLLIDGSVRELDARTEVHHRESYTANFPNCIKRDFGTSPDQILMYYTLMGVRPADWLALKEAFMFAMKSHNPYIYEDHDKADLDKGDKGAVARFFHNKIVGAALGALEKLVKELSGPGAVLIHRQAVALKSMETVGQNFYKRLLTKYPELLDFFAHADMDHLAQHLQQVLAFVAMQGVKLRDSLASLQRLATVHRTAVVPTWAYPLVGEVLLETLSEGLEMPPEAERSWKFLYVASATVIQAPMAVQERVYADAEDFFQTLARDEDWPSNRLEERLKQVQVEIGLSGTYLHSTEELQAGARIAWRNSPKCIGRISWDTLILRDCRNATQPDEIFRETQEHMKLATCDTSIKAVMSVFAPRKPGEKWGTRFWNSQFCRYAAYEQPDGSILGDPANLDYTKVCIEKMKWTPPAKRTAFDILPIIVDVPGLKPQLYEIPKELLHQVPMEHPSNKNFAKLKLQWCAVPVVANFNMRIGGVDYPCCPFNGWFVDLEIARNLVERYDKGPAIAKIMGYDTTKDYTGWRSKVVADMAAAVTHSFRKAHFSIVDHYTASSQFFAHVDREKSLGREVPAQWSWIGGFSGCHCPVWHYEMRDFYLRPQYHYCCDKWVVEGWTGEESPAAVEEEAAGDTAAEKKKVIIFFASVTGTSERFAKRLSAELGLAYQPRVAELNTINDEVLQRYTHVLFVVSTFGDGGPPANGAELKEPLPFQLKNKKTGQATKYAVLALGSSVYPNFCAFGKKVDSMMMKAGGDRFMGMLMADEVKNQGESFTQFLAGVRTQLPPAPAPPDVVPPEMKIVMQEGELRLSSQDSLEAAAASTGHFPAKIVFTKELLEKPEHGRSTRRIDIDVSKCPEAYHTGGHLSVLPANPAAEVVRLGKALGVSEAQMHAPFKAIMVEGGDEYPASLHFNPSTLFEAFTWFYDIKLTLSNVDEVLRFIRDSEGMSAGEFDHMISQDKDQTVSCFWWISRLLENYESTKVSLAKFMQVLGRQTPRLYSIASSNVASPTVVSLCVALVVVEENRGLCSNFLHGLRSGEGLLVVTRSSSFKLPSSPKSPIIMVGPGTGVAPFIGFVQERMALAKNSSVAYSEGQLYFGCRNLHEAIHKDLLEQALKSSAISTYSVSCSREPTKPKAYVSDALKEDSSKLWKALKDPECHYYVCGDGRMADSAYDALLPCIMEHGNMSRAKAVTFLDGMRSQGRYHLDVWGLVLHFQRAKTAMRVKSANRAKSWLKLVEEE